MLTRFFFFFLRDLYLFLLFLYLIHSFVFVSRHWLQHPLRSAGPPLRVMALHIQDGEASAGDLCDAVGHLLLSLG